ncbi:preprotein translocase subunit YajC [Modestobacter sp. VKM Ac-2986]|uniref:preprotein translocase subunit YajC n=1 Tax=Modestobacter sp. VKM Ac-2986 TaxID=3004140 RepID=UPI0022AAED9C|nr:preprotein translocase subunit YajC [Modestobacter sp. VKM Ac-2986]MCZ2828197.1 preprotein translocase subunit YajC [Modestobacter sp. VKM Ac-2986]
MEYLPLIVLVLLFGLLIVLPARQRKKIQANAAAMQAALTPGTPVMLTSGIHGTVAALGADTVDLEVSPGVVITVARPAVLEVRKPLDAGTTGGSTAATGSTDGDGDPADRAR